MAETDKYDLLQVIGHGSFGVIRKVRHKASGRVLCRKEISYVKMSQKEREQLHVEFQILSTLRHPNIVGYYHREHLKATQDLHLYMEYCGNGDLGRMIRELGKKNEYAQESFVWSTLAQLVTALYRCHYGVDPPEVGKDVLGLGPIARPSTPGGGITILHRDLKPENVFLDDDNSVKLGDFGLSKMIQSHDFASTYVGTPFYMSPEICAAEKYTLKSDIWSLGCIVYELCTREPPFNAKSHVQLVQKIRDGKVAPLPDVYSAELMSVIKNCLRVNPDRRPDTAALLNLPAIRLMRKEREVVDLNKTIREKEQSLIARRQQLEDAANALENTLRLEWEVKAALEIDRRVNLRCEELKKDFDRAVQQKVEEELNKRKGSSSDVTAQLSSSIGHSDYPHSSVGTSGEGDSADTTDLTELSVDSSDNSTIQMPRRVARAPLDRAQTMCAGAPADMIDSSPMQPTPSAGADAISKLQLSPRRNPSTKAPVRTQSNIFAIPSAIADDPRWKAPRDQGAEWDSDSDAMLSPSPTVRSSKNPFGRRPNLPHLKTAPIQSANMKLKTQVASIPQAKTISAPTSDPYSGPLKNGSPNRRLSKIPSKANLAAAAARDAEAIGKPPTNIPTRKTSGPDQQSQQYPPQAPLTPGGGLPTKKGNLRGRTLIELSQARAGGRPLSAVAGFGALAAAHAGEPMEISPKRGLAGLGGSDPGSVPVWEDDDEMPSPFLIRRRQAPTGA